MNDNDDKRAKGLRGQLPGQLRGLASQLTGRALRDPRLQDMTGNWRTQAEQLRGKLHDRADERLEELLEQRRQTRGDELSPEVEEVLAERRRERLQRAAELRWRSAVLEQAQTPEERRVLLKVLDGRQASLPGAAEVSPRYTELLDTLAPGAEPAQEMAIHRAIWRLAERRVLAVSSHGEITVTFSQLPDVTL